LAENDRVKKGCSLVLVHRVWPEGVGFRDLAAHLQLIALSIEHGAKRAGKSRLKTVVARDTDIEAIIAAKSVVDTSGPKVFFVYVSGSAAELESAGNTGRQTRKALTSAVGNWGCTRRSRCTVIHSEICW